MYRTTLDTAYRMTAKRGKRGRAIIDLMVVIAVIAIFTTFAMMVLSRFAADARRAVLRANVGSLYVEMVSMAHQFDRAHLFATSESVSGGEAGAQNIFCLYLKAMLDSRSAEADANSYRNPASGSVQVVCDTAFPPTGEYARPAVLITDNASARYGSAAESNADPDLRGSLVVVLANGRDEAEVYYVDETGVKSGVCYHLRGFGGG